MSDRKNKWNANSAHPRSWRRCERASQLPGHDPGAQALLVRARMHHSGALRCQIGRTSGTQTPHTRDPGGAVSAPLSFQDTILALKRYWSERGCIIQEPYDVRSEEQVERKLRTPAILEAL